MNDRKNKKLDLIERKLLKASRISSEELREIVSAPQLFDRINARIKTEQAAQRSKNAAGQQTIFPVWRWQKAGLAFGGLLVFLAVGASLIFFTRPDFSTAQFIESVAAPEVQKPIASVETLEPEISESRNEENPVGKRNVAQKLAFKNNASKTGNRTAGINSAKRSPRLLRTEPEEIFYPLAFAENLEEAKEDGQVIRVELSRSSLLALGINPPMDDETLKIKTDLLIGSDGVARGIRFVK